MHSYENKRKMTLSESSPILQPFQSNGLHLHNLLTQHQILKLHQKFLKAPDKRLTSTQLREAIFQCSEILIDEENYKIIFLQIDATNLGFATWDDFISYLINGLKNQEIGLETKSLHTPIPKLPRLIQSNHRFPITQIAFKSEVSAQRTFNFTDGEYITMSKDGCFNIWSVNFILNKSFYAKSPKLKFCDTVTTCFTTLADVNVLCVGTTESDLRFYDISAGNCQLRLHITNLRYTVTALEYTFSENIEEDSRLFFGDIGGNLHILFFSSVDRGPFRSSLESPVYNYKFNEVIIGNPNFRYLCFNNLHVGWIRQVEYYSKINFIVTCSSLPSDSSLKMHKITNDQFYCFNQLKEVWCFATAEGKKLIASGGPECVVKVWNPFITRRPVNLLIGHKTGITRLIFQDKGAILCSMSEDKCIKVWDTLSHLCLQTYLALGNQIGEHTDIALFYNPDSRQLILGGMKIGVLPLNSIPNAEYTDGSTHIGPVSVLLYNPLFKLIITCGLDSLIMVWEPWTGRRLSLIREAHTRRQYGQVINVEITSGCFDPGLHYLLTGATDGSIKAWNFNSGTCIRHLKIEENCEVTGVFWLPDRILAMGWDKHITEFSTEVKSGKDSISKKNWKTKHTYEILCSAAHIPHTLVTGTYNGELIFWNLITSQPYRQYNVAEPTKLVKIDYETTKNVAPKLFSKRFSRLSLRSLYAPVQVKKFQRFPQGHRGAGGFNFEVSAENARGLAVRAALFLTSRPAEVGVGNLLVAVENGEIQVWSVYKSGGFIESFLVTHSIGDYVVSMATDEKNEYLFLGTVEGYIKTFLLKGYLSGDAIKVSLPHYRLIFPFMWDTLFIPRAKRALRNQRLPVLLNSYKAHRSIVSSLIYLAENKMLISASTDFTVRLWTLNGKYLGTLGTFKKWLPMSPEEEVGTDVPHRVPPDIKRVASSTTLRVLMGNFEKIVSKKQKMAEKVKEVAFEGDAAHGKRSSVPILGHYFKSTPSCYSSYEHNLRNDLNLITVYQQSNMPEPSPIIMSDLFSTKRKQMTENSED